jgi:hypothetical protein
LAPLFCATCEFELELLLEFFAVPPPRSSNLAGESFFNLGLFVDATTGGLF